MGPQGRRIGGGIKLLPIILAALYMGYFYFSNRQTVPLTGRKQLVDISREQEAALGLQSYRQVMQQSRVVRDGQAAQLVRDVGQKTRFACPEARWRCIRASCRWRKTPTGWP